MVSVAWRGQSCLVHEFLVRALRTHSYWQTRRVPCYEQSGGPRIDHAAASREAVFAPKPEQETEARRQSEPAR